MKQPEKSVWITSRTEIIGNQNSDIGIVVINWNKVADSRIQDIINHLYKDNEDIISGMTYQEYGSEMKDVIKKIPAFLEGKYEEKKEKIKQATLF